MLTRLATIGAIALLAGPAMAQDCPRAVPFGANDTLAGLSARCNVPAGDILRANDAADESDLRNAGAVAIPRPEEGDWLDRAREAVGAAGQRAGEAATSAGEAVSGYLSDNPLGRDLLDAGENLGLPGVEAAPTTGPSLAAVPMDDGRLRVSATGFPGNVAVTLSLQRPEATEPLQELQTGPDGSLLAELPWPADLPRDEEAVLVLETADDRIRVTSDPVQAQ